MTQKRLAVRVMALFVLLLTAFTAPAAASAQEDEQCRAFAETDHQICGNFLEYWEANGGLEVFGLPVTDTFQELNWDTLTQYQVQYYERERFEYHPENEGTPYEILLGRLGVNVLEARGIDWTQLPKADPSEPYYMDVTGHAIAPEFWEYWSSHGLELGDEGISFRESLALFGYPITSPAMERNPDGDTVLTQWFERARFELHEDGTVLLGRLGAEMNTNDGQFAVRVQLEFDATLRKAMEDHQADGFLAGVWSPHVGDWLGTIGVADPTTGMPYYLDTRHRIGSVNKTMTATLILQLVDEGQLSLDDTIDQWFDGVTYGDQITVRMLLNMTSGIANFTLNPRWQEDFFANPERVFDPQEIVAYGIEMEPSFEPGAGWEYSNTNYVMLGLIVEAVTGQDIRDLYQERIFEPLGLDETTFPEPDDASLPEPYARGVTWQGLPPEIREATNWNPSWAYAAGQMISTADDLRVWARALATGELVSEEMHAEQLTWVQVVPDVPEVGYGLGIVNDFGWLGHDGTVFGYDTVMLYRPDLDLSLVTLANSDIPTEELMWPAHSVAAGIMSIINREYPSEVVVQ